MITFLLPAGKAGHISKSQDAYPQQVHIQVCQAIQF